MTDMRLRSLAHYVDDERHSDLTLIITEKTYFVHKDMLCSQSVVFQRLLKGHFKESNEHEIKLHDEDPELFDIMLRYIYGEELDKLITRDMGPKICAECFILADKWDVGALRTAAINLFKNRTENSDRWKDDSRDFVDAIDFIFATNFPQSACFKQAVYYAVYDDDEDEFLGWLLQQECFLALVRADPTLVTRIEEENDFDLRCNRCKTAWSDSEFPLTCGVCDEEHDDCTVLSV